jgi:hypothetical protein
MVKKNANLKQTFWWAITDLSGRVKKIRKWFIFRSGESLAKNELHLLNGLNLRKDNQSHRAFYFYTTPDPDPECQFRLMRIHSELTLLLADFAVILDDKFLHFCFILRKSLVLELN